MSFPGKEYIFHARRYTDGIGIFARNGQVIVTGAEGETVQVFGVMGRHTTNEMLPNSVFLVKIGNHPARRVVVMR